MRLLLCGTSFMPSYGGPAFSVSRLGYVLAKRGIKVTLWAPDGSAETSPVIFDTPGLQRAGGPLDNLLWPSVRPHLIHDNGIWLPHNHKIARLSERLSIRRVVTLRGMLEPWALKYRRWKKFAAWHAYQRRDLEMADILHATADSEADNARMVGLTQPIMVVPNGVDFVPEDSLRKNDGFAARTLEIRKAVSPLRRALFLSRIHPKKGLPMLLDAWASLHPEGWELVIAGPTEGNHEIELRRRVSMLGLDGSVKFVGEIHGTEKSALFCSADFFVLPTHSENFGIAIAEALAHEVPVLTTTGTPWGLLETQLCGWWVAPTSDGIRAGLSAALSKTDGERKIMGRRGRLAVEASFSWERIAAAIHENIYTSLLK